MKALKVETDTPPHLFSEITFVFQFKITNAAFHNYSPRFIEKIKFIIFFLALQILNFWLCRLIFFIIILELLCI